jgi:hypothetical protein
MNEQLLPSVPEDELPSEGAGGQVQTPYEPDMPVYMRPLNDMRSTLKGILRDQRARNNLGEYTPASDCAQHTMPKAPKDMGGLALRFEQQR